MKDATLMTSTMHTTSISLNFQSYRSTDILMVWSGMVVKKSLLFCQTELVMVKGRWYHLVTPLKLNQTIPRLLRSLYTRDTVTLWLSEWVFMTRTTTAFWMEVVLMEVLTYARKYWSGRMSGLLALGLDFYLHKRTVRFTLMFSWWLGV